MIENFLEQLLSQKEREGEDPLPWTEFNSEDYKELLKTTKFDVDYVCFHLSVHLVT